MCDEKVEGLFMLKFLSRSTNVRQARCPYGHGDGAN